MHAACVWRRRVQRPSAASTTRLSGSPGPLGLACVPALVLCACSDGSGAPSPPPVEVETLELGFGFGYEVELEGGGVTDSLLLDFDGDGTVELVHAGSIDQALHIGYGIEPGDPQVGLEQTIVPGGTPLRVVAGDFDGDGRQGFALLSALADPDQGPEPAAEESTLVVVYEPQLDGWIEEVGRYTLPGSSLFACSAKVFGGVRDQLIVADSGGAALQLFEVVSESVELVQTIQGPSEVALTVPFSVAALDATGDGLLDIVYGTTPILEAGPSIGAVVLLEQNPNGTFALPVTLGSGYRFPLVEAVPDLDGDGLEELAVSDLFAEVGDGDDGMLRLFWSAAPAFGSSQVLLPAGEEPGGCSDVLVCDLDRDGHQDLVAAWPQVGAVLWFAGPELTEAVRYGPVHQARRVHLHPGAEVPILLATGIGRSVWLPWQGEPADPLRVARAHDAGDAPGLLDAADLDGDGYVDALVVDAGQSELRFLRGGPQLDFELAGALELTPNADETPGGVRLCDLDGDGDLDVALATYKAGALSIFENDGSLPFGSAGGGSVTYAAGVQPIDLTISDLDGDGLVDAALADAGANQLVLLRGTGAPTFDPGAFEPWAQIPLPARPLAMLAADLDADGAPELAVTAAEPNAADPRLLVFRPAQDGPFPFELVFFSPLDGVGTRLRAGDVNGDGRPDIACGQGSQWATGVAVYLTGGDLTQFERIVVPTGPGSSAFDLLDLDGDAHLDLVTARTDGHLGLFLGSGAGSFAPAFDTPVQASTPFATSWLDLADLDDDGLPELMAVTPMARNLWVARNTSQAAQ